MHSTLAQRALTDIWAFADLINFRGGQKNFYPLHKEMAEFNCRQQTHMDNKREYRRRLFLVPREHRKSTVNTVLYTLWRVYRNPNIRIVVGCCVKDLASSFIREIRQYFEDTDLVENVWDNRPHISGPLIPALKQSRNNYRRSTSDTEAVDTKVIWSSYSIQVLRTLKDKQPTVEAKSVGMSLAGVHCDLLILDDIVNWTNSESDLKARKLRNWVSDCESVLTKKAVRETISPGFEEYVGNEILLNGTRYYAHDYYSHIVGNSPEQQEQRLSITRYSAFIRDVYIDGNKDNGFICPEIFDAEAEEDILGTEGMSVSHYYAQFRNIIIADEENTVISEDSIRVVMPGNYKRTTMPHVINFIAQDEQTEAGPKVYPIHVKMFLDLAASVSKKADSSGYIIGGWDEKHRFHVVAGNKGRWKPQQHYEAVRDAAIHWNLTNFYFESGVGYQSTFKEGFMAWLKYNNYAPLHCIPLPVSRSITKNDRIKQTLSPISTDGRLFVCSSLMNKAAFKAEVRFYNPAATNNSDDFLDMMEMCARNTSPRAVIKTDKDKNKYRHLRINKMFGGVI